MSKKTKKSSSRPLADIKFGIYSFLQACIVISTFVLILKLVTFKLDTTPVDSFVNTANAKLDASISHTALVVSNLVQLVYTMPQLNDSYHSLLSPSFDLPTISDSPSSTNFVARYVHDFSYSKFSGVSSFVCSDVAGVYRVGDVWIDGAVITHIHDKGFSTALSPWFAQSLKGYKRSVAPLVITDKSKRREINDVI